MCRFVPLIEGFHYFHIIFFGMGRLGPLVGFPVNLVGVLFPGMGRLCRLVVVCVISVGVLPPGVDRCVPWLDNRFGDASLVPRGWGIR